MIMDITRHNGTLRVTGFRELNSAEAHSFCSALAISLPDGVRTIEIDLSQIQDPDGAGLGALVSLYETANQHSRLDGVALRLTDPDPPVHQLIELARLHHLFEIKFGHNVLAWQDSVSESKPA